LAVTRPTARRRAQKRPRYGLRRLLILLLLLLPFVAWKAWAFWESIPLQAEGAAPRVVVSKPVYVAIMGVDEREHDSGRSDTLLLMRLDPTTKKVDVVNIPRDTRITYSSGKESKINAAYAIDGPELTTEVVGNLLGIDRPYYVTVNFNAFEELVNQVGGVEMTVEKHYVYDDPYQDLHIDIKPGRQTMYGETALQYVRLRYDGVTNSDIARIGRQQEFLRALVTKVPSNWTRIPAMISTVRKYVKTNIPEGDQLKLAKALWEARGNLAMQTLPGTAAEDETGDWLIDQPTWSEVIRAWRSNTP
jgi:polyisoprenyl-teichoic acid--peptidoglycan teichoic acid transferase